MSRSVASHVAAEQKVQDFISWWSEHYPVLLAFIISVAERIAPRRNDHRESLRVLTALLVGLNGLRSLIDGLRVHTFGYLTEMAHVSAPLPKVCREVRLGIVLGREDFRKFNEATDCIRSPEAREEVRNAIILIASVAIGAPN